MMPVRGHAEVAITVRDRLVRMNFLQLPQGKTVVGEEYMIKVCQIMCLYPFSEAGNEPGMIVELVNGPGAAAAGTACNAADANVAGVAVLAAAVGAAIVAVLAAAGIAAADLAASVTVAGIAAAAGLTTWFVREGGDQVFHGARGGVGILRVEGQHDHFVVLLFRQLLQKVFQCRLTVPHESVNICACRGDSLDLFHQVVHVDQQGGAIGGPYLPVFFC